MHSCSKLFTCSSWKGARRENQGISKCELSDASGWKMTQVQPQIHICPIWRWRGLRCADIPDHWCAPSASWTAASTGSWQRRLYRRNTQYGFYGNTKPRSYGNRGHLKNLSPQPWQLLSSHACAKDWKGISKSLHPIWVWCTRKGGQKNKMRPPRKERKKNSAVRRFKILI